MRFNDACSAGVGLALAYNMVVGKEQAVDDCRGGSMSIAHLHIVQGAWWLER